MQNMFAVVNYTLEQFIIYGTKQLNKRRQVGGCVVGLHPVFVGRWYL